MYKEQSTFFSFQAIRQQFGDSIKNIKTEKKLQCDYSFKRYYFLEFERQRRASKDYMPHKGLTTIT